MRRSVLAVAMLLIGAVACEAEPEEGPAPDSKSGPSAKPLTVRDAQRVVVGAAKKNDSDSLSEAYWRGVAEGPWLEQNLARVENIKKRGDDAPPAPTNSPQADPTVHTWTISRPDGSDRWIWGAQQTRSRTVGDSKNTVSMRWTLHHQQKDGSWRQAFTVDGDTKTSLPQLAGSDGQAVSADEDERLTAAPSLVCGLLDDYITRKGGRAQALKWSAKVDDYRSGYSDIKSLRKNAGDAKTVTIKTEPTRKPVGPAWRTKDGAGLVPCVSVNTVSTDMGPGNYVEFTSSGWTGTTGIRWAKYTQTTMMMTVLKVPAGTSEIGIAAQTTWPHTFEGTRYTGK